MTFLFFEIKFAIPIQILYIITSIWVYMCNSKHIEVEREEENEKNGWKKRAFSVFLAGALTVTSFQMTSLEVHGERRRDSLCKTQL